MFLIFIWKNIFGKKCKQIWKNIFWKNPCLNCFWKMFLNLFWKNFENFVVGNLLKSLLYRDWLWWSISLPKPSPWEFQNLPKTAHAATFDPLSEPALLTKVLRCKILICFHSKFRFPNACNLYFVCFLACYNYVKAPASISLKVENTSQRALADDTDGVPEDVQNR